MTATLEWNGRTLMMIAHGGAIREVGEVRGKRGEWVYELRRGLTIQVSDPYELIGDARHDAESEVRRLLKEAGVICE